VYIAVGFARLHTAGKRFVYFPVVGTIFFVISFLQVLSDLIYWIIQGGGDKISW
jgi:hypothetical protein